MYEPLTMEGLKRLLISYRVSQEDYNSNNGWGFGGAVGTLYKLKDGLMVLVATACFRHMKSYRFIKVYTAEKVYSDQYSNYSGRMLTKEAIRNFYKEAVNAK